MSRCPVNLEGVLKLHHGDFEFDGDNLRGEVLHLVFQHIADVSVSLSTVIELLPINPDLNRQPWRSRKLHKGDLERRGLLLRSARLCGDDPDVLVQPVLFLVGAVG